MLAAGFGHFTIGQESSHDATSLFLDVRPFSSLGHSQNHLTVSSLGLEWESTSPSPTSPPPPDCPSPKMLTFSWQTHPLPLNCPVLVRAGNNLQLNEAKNRRIATSQSSGSTNIKIKMISWLLPERQHSILTDAAVSKYTLK